jgi:N-acetylmuramoyl-L-alanine amidase
MVVLDPAGDAKRTGRRIGDSFERGLTLQCVEKIKEYIEAHAPHIKVVITRMPGDTVYDLQNASLANRINADLFVNLNFYYTQETKPTVYVYQFSYGNDFAVQQYQGLQLHSYDQAYLINKHVTDAICVLFKKQLSDAQWQSLFSVAAPGGLPIKPLIGIVAPSITLEAGLKHKELWHCYSEPIARAIIAAVDEME